MRTVTLLLVGTVGVGCGGDSTCNEFNELGECVDFSVERREQSAGNTGGPAPTSGVPGEEPTAGPVGGFEPPDTAGEAPSSGSTNSVDVCRGLCADVVERCAEHLNAEYVEDCAKNCFAVQLASSACFDELKNTVEEGLSSTSDCTHFGAFYCENAGTPCSAEQVAVFNDCGGAGDCEGDCD